MNDSNQNSHSLPSPSDIAHDRVPAFQVAQNEKTWAEKVIEEREKKNQEGDNDQNELEKARILPVEERDRGGRGR